MRSRPSRLAPQFLGRSGSFYFDPGQAQADIRAVVDEEPGLQPYAWHTRLTQRVSERKIQFCAEQMEWSETPLSGCRSIRQRWVGCLAACAGSLRSSCSFRLTSAFLNWTTVSQPFRFAKVEASVLGDSRVLLTEDGRESE